MAESLPRVCVLGGTGFIGRHFVRHLVENKLASYVFVADKSPPGLGNFSEDVKAAFGNKDIVQFKQSDLARDAHVNRTFTEFGKFDYVVNLCGETRCSMSENDYKTRSVDPATKCGAAAQTAGVKKFIEISDARIYAPEKNKGVTEDSAIAPWTSISKFRYQAEEALRKVEGLPLIVLRPAIVYGRGDKQGILPRCACAAVYKKKNEKMKTLWGKKVRVNTLHVDDLVLAIWHACTASEVEPGTVWNLADSGNSTLGSLNAIIGEIFGIKTGFMNAAINMAAKTALGVVTERVNEKHVPDWAKICKEANILNTPLTPYLDREQLLKTNVGVDGTKITSTGFEYTKPKVTREALDEMLAEYISQELFPPVLG